MSAKLPRCLSETGWWWWSAWKWIWAENRVGGDGGNMLSFVSPIGPLLAHGGIFGQALTQLHYRNYECVEKSASYCSQGSSSAFAIQVRWQSSDIPHLQAASTTIDGMATTILNTGLGVGAGVSASIAEQTSSSSTTASSPASSSTSTSHGGLSTGAKAGIGVAVPIAVLSIIAGVLYFLWRRRRAKRLATARSTSDPPPPELGNHAIAYATGPGQTMVTSAPQIRQQIPSANMGQWPIRQSSPTQPQQPQQAYLPLAHLTRATPVQQSYPYSQIMQQTETTTIPQPFPAPIPLHSHPASPPQQPYDPSIQPTPPNAYPPIPSPPPALPLIPSSPHVVSTTTAPQTEHPYKAPPEIATAAANSGSNSSSDPAATSDPTSTTSLSSPVSSENSQTRLAVSRPNLVTRSSEKAPIATATEISPSSPPLNRVTPSEMAPEATSPPGHYYPEVVSVSYPFPPPQDAQSMSTVPEEEDEEIRRIRTEQVRLQERRNRLTQLYMIDEEEARLQRDLEMRMAQIARRRMGSL
ncbi:hypothetical protein NA57DRAFT_80790 [Rhizodiscina lignyota]|uniref:Uncharacterized protein n=1 Tax=Rhizodiscina lignyota TaxID=1504668 RepID=A0A9P4M5F5_9PEZI|nr:hypothetical protein NA57DRAFT_80790 [Rhizodiscina lignyota]